MNNKIKQETKSKELLKPKNDIVFHALFGEDKICQWMMFLDDPNKKEVEEIMKANEDIKEAVEELTKMSKDEELRRLAELREKGRRDYNAGISLATERGIEKGIKQGIKQGEIEIAIKMLNKKMTIEDIIELTGLPKKEIEKLMVNV